MPLRIFKGETSSVAQRERREQLEKALADGFRTLSQIFQKTAELIEQQRLQRGGYEKQEKFLERSEPKEKK
ncbi:MAG: hypothetical protein ACO1OB_01870 [Archangium sp.]